ncbi:hypothetical protein DFH08DRAFT_993917 [Mycena albidolilacea]|uniref:Uncharacterized protein n=1 Tax=Mycena albidolilacea TaxID=1033008 RepID=A0AAD6YXM9_9AGAR|nr:hypothetical protein DFH08DRAFT_993917 [Mycena albidolilacea]
MPLPRAAQHHRHAEPMQLMLLRRNNDAMRQYARDRDADAHSDHACSLPKILSDATPLSQPQPPLLSLSLSCSTSWHIPTPRRDHRRACLRAPRSLHVDPRAATHRLAPMTGFPNLKAGSPTPAVLSTYLRRSSLPSPVLTSLRTILTPLDLRLARRRAHVHPAARHGDHARRGPHLRCIAFQATRDCADSGCRNAVHDAFIGRCMAPLSVGAAAISVATSPLSLPPPSSPFAPASMPIARRLSQSQS